MAPEQGMHMGDKEVPETVPHGRLQDWQCVYLIGGCRNAEGA